LLIGEAALKVETWALFVAVSLLPVISPGPAILLAISNALRFGPKSVVYSALGNAIGLTLLGFAVAFGLAALLHASALAFTVVKFAGAAYLCYLGVKLWRDGKSLAVNDTAGAPLRTPLQFFGEALFVSLTNPKALVVLAALLPPFVNKSDPVIPQVAVMSVTYAALCFLNHLALAFAGGHVRRFLSSEPRVLALRRTLGALFIGFGAALAAAKQ
jgi:threonine/homoserine/homoserine lactone efflux protein